MRQFVSVYVHEKAITNNYSTGSCGIVNLKKEYYGNEYGKNICVTETKLTITSLWDKHAMPSKGNDPYAGIVKNPPSPPTHTHKEILKVGRNGNNAM